MPGRESNGGLGRRTNRTEADETSNLVACSVVIMDGDPPPTAAIGRISCNRKNPDIEVRNCSDDNVWT